MKRRRLSHPDGAPPGTVWFGGPMDRFMIELRIVSEELDTDRITAMLRYAPTEAWPKGRPRNDSPGAARLAMKHRWSLSIDSDVCGDCDVECGIMLLLAKLPDDPDLWDALSRHCEMSILCSVVMEAANRGLELTSETCHALALRHLSIGFDIYYDPAD
jgi:hypothetical protein